MTTPILQLLNVESNYGPVQALRGVSLSVAEGRIVTVLGANGAGKTTTLKTISGIIDPLKGQVKFRGQEIQGARARRDRARRHRACPGGARGLPAAQRRGQSAHGRLYAQRPGRRRARPRSRVRLFPDPARTRQARRPASSPAGSSRCWRSRAPCWRGPRSILMDEPSLGLSPQAHQGNLRYRGADQSRARRDHPAGGAERPHGAQDRGFRLCARGRAHRDGGYRRAACRKGRHPRILSRHEGRRRDEGRGDGNARNSGGDGAQERSPTPFRRCSGAASTEWRTAGQPAAEAFRHLAEHHLGRVRPVSRARSAWGWWRSALRRANAPRCSPTPTANGSTPTWAFSAPAACRTASIRPTRRRRSNISARIPSTVYLFVEDDEQLDKALEVRAQAAAAAQDRRVRHGRPARFLRPAGDQPRRAARDRARLRRRASGASGSAASRCASPTDLAVLIYTSGTTGKPKGAMLSHANLVAAMQLYAEAFAQHADDERMCFLPLCHVAERVVGVYTAFLTGTRLNFVENPETVPENVREIAPTVFGAVPRIWEKFYSVVLIRVRRRAGCSSSPTSSRSASATRSRACARRASRCRRILPPRSGSRACWCSTTSAGRSACIARAC